MLIGRHTKTTRTLGAPRGWDQQTDGRCGRLPIADAICEAGPVMESAWEPTPEEIALIAAGAPVILGIFGEFHPPVYLRVGEAPKVS